MIPARVDQCPAVCPPTIGDTLRCSKDAGHDGQHWAPADSPAGELDVQWNGAGG